MITAIVWSKNRAAQCHLLLESIKANFPHTFDVNVIYKADGPNHPFQMAYNDVVNSFGSASFYREDDKHTLSHFTKLLVNEAHNHIAFFTDDTVLYRKSPIEGPEFLKMMDKAVFSLRLGFNTIVQNYHTGECQPPLNHYAEEKCGRIVQWDFNQHHPLTNYGYPFGLDGHIFDADIMRSLLKRFEFRNTNELESKLFHFKNYIPQYMRSFKHSIAVNVPANVQSGITRGGENYGYSLEELNTAYLAGKRISLASIMSHQIYGCHQELPFVLLSPGEPDAPTNLTVELETDNVCR